MAGFGSGLGLQAVASSDFIHGLEQMAEKKDELAAANAERQAAKVKEAKDKTAKLALGDISYDRSGIDPIYWKNMDDASHLALGEMTDLYDHRRSNEDFQTAISPVIQGFKNEYDKYAGNTQAIMTAQQEAANGNPEAMVLTEAYRQSQGDPNKFVEGIHRTPNALKTFNYDDSTGTLKVSPLQTVQEPDKYFTQSVKGISPDAGNVVSINPQTQEVTIAPKKEDIQKASQLQYQANPVGSKLWNTFIKGEYGQYVQPVYDANGNVTDHAISQEAIPAYKKWIYDNQNEKAAKVTKKYTDLNATESAKAHLIELRSGEAKDQKFYETVVSEQKEERSKQETITDQKQKYLADIISGKVYVPLSKKQAAIDDLNDEISQAKSAAKEADDNIKVAEEGLRKQEGHPKGNAHPERNHKDKPMD